MASKRTRSPLTCQSCYETEKFDDMVMCRSCHQWEHFCCGGVGPKIKNHDWQCSLCKAADMAAVRKDLKALNFNHEETKRSVSQLKEDLTMGKTEIIKTVAAAATVAESVAKEVEILNSEHKAGMSQLKEDLTLQKTEIIETLPASASYAKAIGKKVKVLNSDGKHLKAAVFEMKDHLNEIKETIKAGKNVKIDKTQESMPSYQLSMLPSNTLDELKNLLDYVQSVGGYKEFKANISALCGNDLKKSIRAILNHIMAAEVQKKLSWSGYRTNKPSFEKGYRRIVNAITETLQQKFKDYNYDILQKKISTLLSNA